MTTTRAFDARTGRITAITSEDVLDRQVQALRYEWDLVGNLTERMEASVGKDLTEAFTYDTLNRLTQSRVTEQTGESTTPTVRTAQVLRYDALGNITCKSDVDGTDCTTAGARNYTYGTTRPHAVVRAGNLHYTCDANGNVLTERRTGATRDARTFTYNAFNKVKQIKKGAHTTNFIYGPARTRYKRTDKVVNGATTSTTTTLYLGNVEKVIAPGGQHTYKRYIADGVLIEQTYNTGGARSSEDTRYLLHDHLGSIDVITNVIGTVVQDLSFDAWGQRRAPDKWTVLALLTLMDTAHGRYTTRGYTGHEMLDAVGVIHMNGRIYDPKLGRFLQADPVIQFPDYSQSWNRYSYVLNNPLNATDPTGYILSFIGGVFGGAIGFFKCGYACAVVGAAIGAGLGATADVLIRGGNFGQALLAGVFAAALTYAGGRLFPGRGAPFGEVLLYGLQMGVIGGITTTLQGGRFGHGFVVAGTAALVGGALGSSGWFRGLDPGGQLLTSMVAGGTVSRITGGKFANGALTSAFAFLVNNAAQRANMPDFSKMTKAQKVAWIQENAERLGLDFSNVRKINLDYSNEYNVVGIDRYGVPIKCSSDCFPWGGAFNTKTGTLYIFGEGFKGVSNLQIPTRIGSDGLSVLESVSRTYTPMENLVHTIGHEVGHSLGYDVGTVWHIDGERMGMDAVDRFRGV